MFRYMMRRGKYLVTKIGGRFKKNDDPIVQLDQAIGEAKSQHIRLKEQAANVIANQKQAEIRLNKKLEDLEKLHINVRRALIMASDAQTAGDVEKAEQYTHTAETIADKLISIESDVDSLKAMVLESTQAADQAKTFVQHNSRLMQEKIAEKSKPLSQLDQAKKQAEMNEAMGLLTETVGADVPTFDEIQEKIAARYAKAKAPTELTETSIESHVVEVERAAVNVAARHRLSELRVELGLEAGGSPTTIGSREAGSREATADTTRSGHT